MYSIVLFLHSWLRWVVVAALAFTAYRVATAQGDDAKADLKAALPAVIACDAQLTLGLLLHLGLSPLVAAALANFGLAMKDRVLRFWAVEHATLMIAAVALVHVGRVIARRAPTAERRRRALLASALAALALVLVGMPWPFLAQGRPLFRL